MEEDKKLEMELEAIFDKQNHYGTCPIIIKKVNDDVTWVGTNGYTDSIGQWIRKTRELLDEGLYVYEALAVYTNIGKNQKMWYFGLQIGDCDNKTYYFCGGATDFSGEGNFGRLLAEYYISKITGNIHIQNSDFLISLLTTSD
jgi:hypothetical protein